MSLTITWQNGPLNGTISSTQAYAAFDDIAAKLEAEWVLIDQLASDHPLRAAHSSLHYGLRGVATTLGIPESHTYSGGGGKPPAPQ